MTLSLSLQEANDNKLPGTQLGGPVRPTEPTVDQQSPLLSQFDHSAVISSQSDKTVSTTSNHSVPQTSVTSHGGVNLNTLMADLDRNMTQQGVSTVPKGHCSACSKPIIGQVI